ncbi:MAG: 2-hydroxyacyl-CoA dehydratase [Deltaproteobacteria bacterium]|nr:2-hydroxyacyl-CoA dehydratase [Deltaproteobacteria bacterium]
MKTKSKSKENLTRIMERHYMENHIGKSEGKLVVWIAILVPTEILLGFDAVVCVPESHSAMSAARKVGVVQCEKAESAGYSMDLCSYARIDLGTVFDSGKDSPSKGLPMPDLLISNNDNCSLIVKWFDVLSREYDIPHFIMDIPFCYEPQQEKDRRYILDQFEGLISYLEEKTGQKHDMEKTKTAMRETAEATKYWGEFVKLADSHPSGNTAFDTFAQMAPMICMSGDRELADHYKILLEETRQEMAAGHYPVPNEKYRLLWDSIAPWHQLNAMKSRLKELDTNIVFSTYASSMGRVETGLDVFPWDGKADPLWYLARIQNRGWCCYGLELRYHTLAEMIKRYDIHGLVFGSNRSCKPYSIMQMDLQRRLSKDFNIPATMIDVDHADVRKYSEETVFVRLEALIENIVQDQKKKRP